ncbi:GMC oxidoreductase [Pseudomonadales bacterium]|nr:GMC oxidoreductase [Pseudomonadales bacterium]
MQQVECFDICIIGSGPAGAFVANEMSTIGQSIVIVESGNDSVDMDITNSVDLQDSNISGDINFGMSSQVGGASNLWGGWLVKLDKIDFTKRSLFNFKGWPIKFDELLSYYKRVDNYLELNGALDSKYGASNLDLRESEIMDSPFKTRSIIGSDISLLIDMEAQKFICDSSYSKILSLACLDKKTNTVKYLKAKNYVLAAGGINNNRIMLHSFARVRNHLAFDFDVLGKCISTHPKAEIGKIILYSGLDKSHDFINTKKKNVSYLKYQVGLAENVLIEHNLLNHCIRIDMPGRSKSVRVLEKLSAFTLNLNAGFVRSLLLSKPFVYFGQVLFKFTETLDFSDKNGNILNVRCFFDQERRSSNEIALSSEISKSGLPLARINWQFEKKDWDNVELFLSLIKKELEELMIGEFIYEVPTSYIGIHSHFIGGTVIGKSGDDSVVDENLKVHGIDNLYISGPSVFPSFGYANPFYTIAALSIRLSDHLKSKL